MSIEWHDPKCIFACVVEILYLAAGDDVVSGSLHLVGLAERHRRTAIHVEGAAGRLGPIVVERDRFLESVSSARHKHRTGHQHGTEKRNIPPLTSITTLS